jgi:DNA-binding MarR family transcriptional regulator
MELAQGRIINAFKKFKEWERRNLPTYGTEAGYDLFLILASLEPNKSVSLKSLYLTINCSESTTRLLFRHLEQDGWIQLTKCPSDGRHRTFHKTEKFDDKVSDWINQFMFLLDPDKTI